MIPFCLSIFFSNQLWMLLFYLKIITSGDLLILLNFSNLILILNVICKYWFLPICLNAMDCQDELTMKTAYELKPSLSTNSSKYSKPEGKNLYIKRWKANSLNQPYQFPLDRLSYLTAKYLNCSEECCFILKNSQLKQLVKKPVNKSIDSDEPHPRTLVSDNYSTYVHRRSAFYKKRNAIIGKRKQLTKPGKRIYFREQEGQELLVFQYSSPYATVIDSLTKVHPSFEDLSLDEEEEETKLSSWTKIKKRMSLSR